MDPWLRRGAIVSLGRLTRRVHPRGIDRVLRLLHDPERRPWSVRDVVRAHSGHRFHVDTASFLEWRLFFYGAYEGETADVIGDLVRPGSQALDVGANVGTHTLVMADAVGPAGRVVACEPNPSVHARLVANVELNAAVNVAAYRLALSDGAGQAQLWVPEPEDADQGTARLGPPLDGGALRAGAATVTVEVDTVDRLASRLGLADVSLIKVDVEGYEASVLAGARRVMTACRPTLLFEYCLPFWQAAGHRLGDVLDGLRPLGYGEFGYMTGERRGWTGFRDGSEVPEFANVVAFGRGTRPA